MSHCLAQVAIYIARNVHHAQCKNKPKKGESYCHRHLKPWNTTEQAIGRAARKHPHETERPDI